MISRRSQVVGAVGLLPTLVLVSSCHAQSRPEPPPDGLPSAPSATTEGGAPARQLSVERIGHFRLPSGFRVTETEVEAAGVAYVASDVRNPTKTRLYWQRWGGRPVVRVDTPRAGWTVTGLTASSRWLAWVEQRGLPEDPMAEVDWRVMVRPVGGGAVRVALESAEATPLTPGVLLAGNKLVYDVYNGVNQRTYDFRVRVLPTGKDTLVAADVAAGQLAFDGEHVITSVTESVGRSPGTSTSDVYLLADDPVPITDDDNSTGPQYADDTLLWVSGDGAWVASWDGSEARGAQQLFRHSDPLPSLGKGFVADMIPLGGFYTGRVLPLDPDSSTRLLPNPQGTRTVGRVVAGGRLVAWTVAPRGDVGRGVELLVARVTP